MCVQESTATCQSAFPSRKEALKCLKMLNFNACQVRFGSTYMQTLKFINTNSPHYVKYNVAFTHDKTLSLGRHLMVSNGKFVKIRAMLL